MIPGFKNGSPQCEWSGTSGVGVAGTPASGCQVYVADALPNSNCDIQREQIKNRLTHDADQLRLQWSADEIQRSEFSNLAATILESRPSLLQRFKMEVARFLLFAMVLYIVRANYRNKNTISRPPGSTLFDIADFFCSKKTLEGIVTPLIADMQLEYNDALAAKRKYKARWVRVRGCWSFFKALGMCSVLKTVVDVWRKISSV